MACSALRDVDSPRHTICRGCFLGSVGPLCRAYCSRTPLGSLSAVNRSNLSWLTFHKAKQHMPPKRPRTVFVTVGTTKFDALVEALDSQHFADLLVSKGYSRLVIQKGAGSYVPHHILQKGETSNQLPNGLGVECFDFSPSLAEYMSAAALVVSHAGSGSIFEALQAGEYANAQHDLSFRHPEQASDTLKCPYA